MTEQLKFIIEGLNKELKTNYDLIKFDSLNEVQHLQILVDLLASYDAGEKFDINEEEPESIPIKLFNMIRNVKYKPDPSIDIPTYRRNLITGERNTIFAILQWLLNNIEKAKRAAYLSKFLIPPDLPNEILGNPDIADLTEIYNNLVEAFKEVHMLTSNYELNSASEVINDLKEMTLERDAVLKRIETAQLNFIDRPNKENLLILAKHLRLEQEKFNKLNDQIAEQRNKLKNASDQVQRNLQRKSQLSAPKSADDLVQELNEELKVNEYLVKEKLPNELSYIHREIKLLQTLHDFGHIQRDNLVEMQEKIESVNQEIETLIQKKLAITDPQDDKLAPFRHQAAVIKRNKEAVAEKLEELRQTFRDLETILTEKQAQVKNLLGDTVLRGEELKKYVNKLRTKSTLYKKQRSTLSALKAEAGVLTRTLEILQSRDSSLEMALLNHKKMNINLDSLDIDGKNGDSLTNKTPQEITQLIGQLSNKLVSMKREISPLVNELKPMREEFQQLQQTYDQKKRVYDSTSINLSSQLEPIETEVTELQKKIDSKEEEWKILRQRIEKAEDLLAIIDQENATRGSASLTPRQPSRLETLQTQIHQQEKQAAVLKEEQKFVSERQAMLGEQSIMWSHLIELLECKIECIEDAKGKQGSVTITEKTQTLTL